jgi:hypothetical protein
LKIAVPTTIATATTIETANSVAARRLRSASARSPSPIALLVIENLLDRQPEQTGDAECERKRRIVLPRLDRIHCLARHAEPAAKLGLAPVAFGAQYFQPVLHVSTSRQYVR